MRPTYAIETKGLSKTYGKGAKAVEALRGMDLRIPQGSLCGLLGLNGAGKSTTLRILLGMAHADSGEAKMLGLNALAPAENVLLRSRTAFLPEQKQLFPYMNIGETLAFTASFYPKWNKAKETHYMKLFQLPYDRKTCHLSKGMLGKLHMLLAICRGAELLILDEPTDGMDAIASEEALQALVGLVADEGCTVLMSSHRLEEIEQVADSLCIVDQGRCLREGSIDDLRSSARRVHLILPAEDTPAAGFEAYGIVKRSGRSMSVLVEKDPQDFIAFAKSRGATDFEAQPVALRELFVDLVRSNHVVA
jgi:ABC-2 type transport system ATP-binding protein